MGLYKTGHKDFPSLSTYTMLVQNHGPDSAQAQSYLGRYLSDDNFVRQAEAVRNMFFIKAVSTPKEEKQG